MQRLTTNELIRKTQEAGDSFLLVNVLDPEFFRKQHIPGSINIPVSGENFVDAVEEQVGSRSEEIVVYCSDSDCKASPTAARLLDEAGFENVYDFEAGIKGWIDADQPVESGRRTA